MLDFCMPILYKTILFISINARYPLNATYNTILNCCRANQVRKYKWQKMINDTRLQLLHDMVEIIPRSLLYINLPAINHDCLLTLNPISDFFQHVGKRMKHQKI
jgi:hypothetical protein